MEEERESEREIEQGSSSRKKERKKDKKPSGRGGDSLGRVGAEQRKARDSQERRTGEGEGGNSANLPEAVGRKWCEPVIDPGSDL